MLIFLLSFIMLFIYAFSFALLSWLVDYFVNLKEIILTYYLDLFLHFLPY